MTFVEPLANAINIIEVREQLLIGNVLETIWKLLEQDSNIEPAEGCLRFQFEQVHGFAQLEQLLAQETLDNQNAECIEAIIAKFLEGQE